ncbi:MAG: CRISPR-associated protein Cas5 [Sulfurimonas sp.]|jgi:CRISPR-associated protein Cas5h|nr:CRISPR-associated protein Cas5 [Sulfurimonas sp.]MDX9744432.1 CRISPR-associated protein Cas5 [Arcobacteraceae bacterium]
MKKQVIKFRLSGDYALFKKPFANNQPQSFVIPPKTAILGLIGAIMGWSKEKYIQTLPFNQFGYAVRLLTPRIKKETVGINLMQGKNGKFTFNENPLSHPSPDRGQRSPTRYEFIKNIEWEIFLLIDNQLIREKLFERLQKKTFVYNPNLGMQQLFARIDSEDLIDIEFAKEINDNLYTSFDKNLVKFTINKPVAFYNELIPVSFNDDRSLPVTKEMISFVGDYSLKITNKDELKEKLYADDDRRLYQFI